MKQAKQRKINYHTLLAWTLHRFRHVSNEDIEVHHGRPTPEGGYKWDRFIRYHNAMHEAASRNKCTDADGRMEQWKLAADLPYENKPCITDGHTIKFNPAWLNPLDNLDTYDPATHKPSTTLRVWERQCQGQTNEEIDARITRRFFMPWDGTMREVTSFDWDTLGGRLLK